MSNTVRMSTLVRALAALKGIEALTAGSMEPTTMAAWNMAMPARLDLEMQIAMFDRVDVFSMPKPAAEPGESAT